jgi:hypothetical protein
MEPIRHLLTVASSAPDAFTVFTTGMGGWWDAAYTPDPGAFTGIEVTPRVGGEVAMLLGPARSPFGTVTAWEPGVHYAQTFWLAMDPSYPSTIEVDFEDVDGVCEVTFAHGGWDGTNAAMRGGYGGWPHLLGRFAAACASAE